MDGLDAAVAQLRQLSLLQLFRRLPRLEFQQLPGLSLGRQQYEYYTDCYGLPVFLLPPGPPQTTDIAAATSTGY